MKCINATYYWQYPLDNYGSCNNQISNLPNAPERERGNNEDGYTNPNETEPSNYIQDTCRYWLPSPIDSSLHPRFLTWTLPSGLSRYPACRRFIVVLIRGLSIPLKGECVRLSNCLFPFLLFFPFTDEPHQTATNKKDSETGKKDAKTRQSFHIFTPEMIMYGII